ncbi:amino acid ABC transporter permease [Candidimonas nitroreducens]|uniref:Amino acid ABC transporter permease n=1 Tax=Candidimonas nitroreducens TaxID=683354 RepID=A0A225MKX5_9BURK|nr:amino acid ABC transporter permease [Candidimonas nitroreducens]OWT61898.1 amino acid ABC transporter permease [Candidimonas nitroreducens]
MTASLWTQITTYTPFLWAGLEYSIRLTVVAAIGGLILGGILAVLRILGWRAAAYFVSFYVNVTRAVPLLLVIFTVYILTPIAIKGIFGLPYPPKISAADSAYFTFALFEAAYYCEIIRSGINGVSSNQMNAAEAIGLTKLQAMRYVVLPQALRIAIPMIVTQIIILFQDASLVSLLNVIDFVGAANIIAERDGLLVEMYSIVAVVYLIICGALSLAVGKLNRKFAIAK